MNSRPRVLVVDDQPANLIAMQGVIDTLDVDVLLARSGPEALRALLIGDFALVILDVQMPEMDGFETAQMIKKRERSRGIPILFLTAISRDAEFVARGYDVGAVDYLMKPVDPTILRSKVAVFADLWRARADLAASSELLRRKEGEEARTIGERRFRDLSETIPAVVWMAEADGTVTYVNAGWRALSGEAADAPAHPFESIVAADDLAPFTSAWRRLVAANEGWQGDVRLRDARTGRLVWHQVRIAPTRSARVDAPAFVATATDVEARHVAEDQLRVLAEVSRALGEGGNSASILRAVAQRTVEAGALACVADLMGPSGWSRVAVASVDPHLAEVLESEPQDEPPRLADHVPGTTIEVPLEARGRVLGRIEWALPDAAPRSLSALFEDVAARTATALDGLALLAEANADRVKLAHANQAKDDFLATLSHELRTPLHAMLGWTKLLRNHEIEGDAVEKALEIIERNARHQARLVADLLDVSRIVSGKFPHAPAPMDLAELVTTDCATLAPVADERGVSLTSDASEPLTISGDRARLHQVLMNLIGNALKFTPRGGRISVLAFAEGGRAVVRIEDTGKGIAPEFLPRVFDRFSQADGSSTRAHGGLGLGLAIVRHVVTAHGGIVEAASDGEGRGATFTLKLPVVDATVERTSAPAEEVEPKIALTDRRVLLVEDDPDSQRLGTTLLRRLGLQVVAVGSVAEAMTAIAAEPFDAIVSDVGLPEEDGYSFMRRLRAQESGTGRRIPAIALTAFVSDEDRETARAAGFDIHLAKPIDADLLSGALHDLLGPLVAKGPR